MSSLAPFSRDSAHRGDEHRRKREPPYLPRRLDPLDHGQADQRPGGQQGQGHLPVEASAVRDAVRDVQGLAVPVVGGGRALLALGLQVWRTQRLHTFSFASLFVLFWPAILDSV